MKVRKAVIPAAGLGTRFLPATKAMPKEMLPIVDKPTIQYIVEEALASGIEEILIITGKGKRAIEDHFDRSIEIEIELERKNNKVLLDQIREISSMVNIHFIRQKEAKGLGHAIACAKAFVGDEPFAVLLGDDVVYNATVPCLKQLIGVYDTFGTSVLGVQEVPKECVNQYGIVAGQSVGKDLMTVDDLVEKPDLGTEPSRVAILGRYIISPAIFDILEKTKPGKGGEIQLTDALKTLAKQETIHAYSFKGKRYDVGSKQGFLEATVEMALRRPELREKFMIYLENLVDSRRGKQDTVKVI